MKRSVVSLLCLLLLFAVSLTLSLRVAMAADRGVDVVGAEGGQQVKGQKWAIVIGVNDYDTVPRLRYCVADAKAMFEALTSPPCGYPRDNIRLLVDDASERTDRPTHSNIIAALSHWLGLAKENDLVLVYFSGHGKDSGDQSFLLPSDAVADNLDLTGVTLRLVREQLRFCKAKRKVLILDMCHAGGKGDEGAMLAATDRLIDQSEGLVTLASCKLKEISYEWDEKQRGVFSYFLTDALRHGEKADKDKDGFVSIDEAYDYVYGSVVRWSAERGQLQTPKKKADIAGQIFLTSVVAAPPLIGGSVKREETNAVLNITSTPAGAAILIDGKNVGTTPQEIAVNLGDAEQKTFKVKLLADGYRVEKLDVNAVRGKVTPVPATLTRAGESGPVISTRKRLGTIIVETGVPEVTVEVDNQKKGVAGDDCKVTITNVPVGRRTVRGTRIGFVAISEVATVEEGQTVTVALGVKRLPRLKIIADAESVGATVEIDGQPAGTIAADTPFERGDLNVGKYAVRVSKDGYVPLEREVEGAAGVVAEVPAKLLKLPAFEITTDPEGCLVEVDDEDLGLSKTGQPIRKLRLSVGQHTLRVSKKGFVAFTQTVDGVGGEVKALRAQLQRSPLLEVTAEAGAQVELDGKVVGLIEGNQPLRIEEVTPGEHQLKASLAGRVQSVQTFTATPGEMSRLKAELLRLPALNLTTKLPKIAVLLDGKEVGQVTDVEALELKNLSAGEHRLTMKAEGKPDWNEALILKGDETKTFELKPPDHATLEITSETAGAQVFLNGTLQGTTDTTIFLEKIGNAEEEVRVELKLDGYVPVTGRARWKIGDNKKFRFALQKTNKVNPVDGAEMVWIPAGEFIMGSDDNDTSADEKPAHRVSLDGYWMYKYVVTVAQYRKFCEATGHKMPGAPSSGWKDDHPIVSLSWNDAKAYCDWAGVGLPTEAQWEKAARGTDVRKYPWGNQWDATKCANSVGDKLSGTKPVGSYPEDVSPYGVYDMAGNVSQWCADWWKYYKNTPAQNPTGPTSGKGRVVRGGSWTNYFYTGTFRCSSRLMVNPVFRLIDCGFRCVSR